MQIVPIFIVWLMLSVSCCYLKYPVPKWSQLAALLTNHVSRIMEFSWTADHVRFFIKFFFFSMNFKESMGKVYIGTGSWSHLFQRTFKIELSAATIAQRKVLNLQVTLRAVKELQQQYGVSMIFMIPDKESGMVTLEKRKCRRYSPKWLYFL